MMTAVATLGVETRFYLVLLLECGGFSHWIN